MPEKKEPYVSQGDRPEVKMDPDKPLSELRVRDLQAILGGSVKVVDKIPEKLKQEKPEKFEKHEKLEKFEKHEKHEKFEFKDHIKEVIIDKLPQTEVVKDFKREKIEKLELEPGPKQVFEQGPDPTQQIDPAIQAGLAQLIQTVGGLAKRVDELANQMAELQKRVK